MSTAGLLTTLNMLFLLFGNSFLSMDSTPLLPPPRLISWGISLLLPFPHLPPMSEEGASLWFGAWAFLFPESHMCSLLKVCAMTPQMPCGRVLTWNWVFKGSILGEVIAGNSKYSAAMCYLSYVSLRLLAEERTLTWQVSMWRVG